MYITKHLHDCEMCYLCSRQAWEKNVNRLHNDSLTDTSCHTCVPHFSILPWHLKATRLFVCRWEWLTLFQRTFYFVFRDVVSCSFLVTLEKIQDEEQSY